MEYGPPIFLLHGPLILLSSLFWLVLFATLIWLLVRQLGAQNRPPFPPFVAHHPGPLPFQQPSALEILRQRYARGEIDAATFDQMRERLEASERPKE
ncbi:MAG: SHOCT domain-containing protein [Ktedonobacteraceae bacterium]|nr:SHOCT domain-containing protein [Ktedonobacteraceae bacterium]